MTIIFIALKEEHIEIIKILLETLNKKSNYDINN